MSTINELPTSEERLNSVRSAFSGVREIIARADSIVDADQYAYVGGGALTLLFATVWCWDPSFLTFISFVGFVLTIADYFGPKLLPYLLSNDWNEEKEKRYDAFCKNLVRILGNVERAYTWYMGWRSQKRLVNFAVTVTSLVVLAWIGNRINNFFLAYLISIAVVLFPKIHRQGLLQQGFSMLKPQLEKCSQVISAQFEILVNKVQHTAKEKYGWIKTE